MAPIEAMVDRVAPSGPIRVLIVEDHAVVRAGLAHLLGTAGDLKVVGEAGNATSAIAFIEGQSCDVVLLDVSLPDAAVLDTIARILHLRSDVQILVVSMHPEEYYAVSLLKAGVSGYFSKSQSGASLLSAIRLVATGHRYLSDALANRLASAASGEAPRSPHARLSHREREVFRRLALGYSVSEIAHEMALSIKTISTYRTRIMDKMGMARNADIIAYAMRHDFLDEHTNAAGLHAVE